MANKKKATKKKTAKRNMPKNADTLQAEYEEYEKQQQLAEQQTAYKNDFSTQDIQENTQKLSDIDLMKFLSHIQQPNNQQQDKHYDMKEFTEKLGKIIATFIKPTQEDLIKVSDLEISAISPMALLDTISKEHHLPAYDNYLASYLKFRISKERKGRQEHLEIIKVLVEMHKMDMINQNMQMMGMGMGNPMMQPTGIPFNMNSPHATGNTHIKQKRKRFGLF